MFRTKLDPKIRLPFIYSMDLLQPNRLLTSATYLTVSSVRVTLLFFKVLLLVLVSGMLPRSKPIDEVPLEKLIFAQLGKQYPIILVHEITLSCSQETSPDRILPD